jgi:hypothetical protein
MEQKIRENQNKNNPGQKGQPRNGNVIGEFQSAKETAKRRKKKKKKKKQGDRAEG